MCARRNGWKNVLKHVGRRNKNNGENKKPRRPRFLLLETLEPRVLLTGNPYISLQNDADGSGSYVASSGGGSTVQIPVRIGNLQDTGTPQDVGLNNALVAMSYATTAPIQTGTACNSLGIQSASENGSAVTLTLNATQTVHSSWQGELVGVSGFTDDAAGYNGTWTILGVDTSQNSITYTNTTSGLATASDEGTASVGWCVEAGTTAEVTTKTTHGFVAGESVDISGMNVSGYNGVFQIASVPSSTTFTFTAPSGLGTSSSTVLATATASIFDLSQTPTVTWGPLVPSGWNTVTGVDRHQPAGTITLLACNDGSATNEILARLVVELSNLLSLVGHGRSP